ncbi:MAG: prepilin-type N-terminal cleavage/methylation domain-containing protein [Candidatus Blackburnbacteria bacterium]|nr:prepilin-type N-terminal cleavage/methylation domain-containing protein [Candidatus Blackburnbacteria bacterium]
MGKFSINTQSDSNFQFSIESTKSGYTLLEVLIVLVIITTLFFGGYTAYREFSRRQALQNFYKELVVSSALAREKALSGEKPSGCNGNLVGYQMSFDSSTYSISAVCNSVVSVTTYSIPSGIVVSGFTNYTYKVLGKGTTLTDSLSVTLTQSSTGKTINATISREGVMQ